MSRSPHLNRDDRGVAALELVLAMPIILALIVCSLAFAGLFQTKSRVVGAARDGARSLALLQVGNVDRNTGDDITVVPDGTCPPLTSPAYQSATPPTVSALASASYTVDVPLIGTWTDIAVTEKATMPCG